LYLWKRHEEFFGILGIVGLGGNFDIPHAS